MGNLYQYNTNNGIIVADTSTIKTEVENEFKTAFGSNLETEASTPQGRLIEMETLARQGVIGLCALVSNQLNIDYATGQYLDAIGSLFGLTRNSATSTSVLATITGVAGTVIPAGSLVESTIGNQFYLENTVTIGTNGQIQAYFLSVEKGAIPLVVGTLTSIVSQIVGWETIYNPAAAQIGIEQESDFDFRRRIKDSRFTGVSLVQSIKSVLNKVENLKSSYIYNNGKGTSVVVDGITIAPHSILVIADGGTDIDVATAVLQKNSSGSDYTAIPNQSTTVSVTDGAYGVDYDVIINRPQVLEFDINITVRQNEYTGSDLQDAVINAILAWSAGEVTSVDGLSIGKNVSPFEIGAAVSEQIPAIFIQNVKVALHGQTPATNELDCKISQIYDIQQANITVNVVS